MTKFIAIIAIGVFSHAVSAQSCQQAAYDDYNDCDKAMKTAYGTNNVASGVASGQIGPQGIPTAATTVSGVATGAVNQWQIALTTCQNSLKDCTARCQAPEDSQYLDACKNSINPDITIAQNQIAGNGQYAQTTGNEPQITGSGNTTTAYNDQDINQAQPDPNLQQASGTSTLSRCMAAASLAWNVATCGTVAVLNPMGNAGIPPASAAAPSAGQLRDQLQGYGIK